MKTLIVLLFLFFSTGYIYSQQSDTSLVDNKVVTIKRLINSNSDSASYWLDELSAFAVTRGSKYGQLKHLFLQGFVNLKRGRFEEAIKLFQKYIQISGDSLNNETIDQVNRIGMCYKFLDNEKKSLFYYEKANSLAKRKNYPKGIADSYAGIGQLLELKGKYEKATRIYLESFDVFKAIPDSLGIGTALNNLGNIMYYQQNYVKAIHYYRQSAQLNAKMKNLPHLATAYGNIAMIYNTTKALDSSLYYNLKCMKILESYNDLHDLGTIYNNIALVYSDLKQVEKAENYHLKSIAIKEKIGDKTGTATSLLNLGNLKMDQRKIHAAIDYYNKGMVLSKELNSLLLEMNAHQGLAKAYSESGLFEKALLHYNFYSDIKDTLNNLEARNRISELEAVYESRRKEELISSQEKEIVAQALLKDQIAATSHQKSIVLGISVIGLAIITFLAALLFKNLKRQRKINEVLFEQKKVIEQKNSENEVLLGEIHHRVKNNLQVISSLLSLQERNLQDSDAKAAVMEGKERVKSMELVHKMLYRDNAFSGIEMKEYVHNLSTGLIESFGLNKEDEQVVLQANFKKVTLDIDTAIPLGLILNELIVNSLKHARQANERLLLKIDMKENPHTGFQLDVSDNGKGRVAEIETSDSFGFKIVKALVKQLKGSLEITEQTGLHYSIEIKNYRIIT